MASATSSEAKGTISVASVSALPSEFRRCPTGRAKYASAGLPSTVLAVLLQRAGAAGRGAIGRAWDEWELRNGTYLATTLVTQTGRLHLASGRYGQFGRAPRPRMPVGEQPVHVRVMDLRSLLAKCTRSYHKALISPECARLQAGNPRLKDERW